jgi:hypothetical protein
LGLILSTIGGKKRESFIFVLGLLLSSQLIIHTWSADKTPSQNDIQRHSWAQHACETGTGLASFISFQNRSTMNVPLGLFYTGGDWESGVSSNSLRSHSVRGSGWEHTVSDLPAPHSLPAKLTAWPLVWGTAIFMPSFHYSFHSAHCLAQTGATWQYMTKRHSEME